jgi:starch phosphorylase
MKAALNGVPQLSTLDGWWAEGATGENGWAIPLPAPEADADQSDMEQLFRLLEQEIVPTFYDRIPGKPGASWARMMKSAMAVSVERFTTRQMLETYVPRYYVPAATGEALPGDAAP